MTSRTKRKIVIVMSLIFALAAGFIVLIKMSSPKLTFEIKSTVVDEMPDVPLVIETGPKSIKFETKFYDLEGNFNTAYLNRRLKFQPSFPFLTVDKNLIVMLIDQEVYEEDSFVYYEISGEITNLPPAEYKLTIMDGFGNLIDETFVLVK